MPPGNELIRTSADLLVLSVLAEGPMYGYAIAKRVDARSDGQIRLTPGVLYPLLHRMEQQKLVLASWETVRAEQNVDDESAGRKRKWYRLSAKGRRRLDQRIKAHRAYQAMIESFLPGVDGATGKQGTK
jgi:PadR family transcriptional regulator PadR